MKKRNRSIAIVAANRLEKYAQFLWEGCEVKGVGWRCGEGGVCGNKDCAKYEYFDIVRSVKDLRRMAK